MRFNVELSELAEKQYDNILSYIANVLKNPQALESVMDDFDDTIVKLEKMADAFEYCKSKRLKGMGLHKIGFENHRYLLVYRVKGSQVIVEGIYHELQDYENTICIVKQEDSSEFSFYISTSSLITL